MFTIIGTLLGGIGLFLLGMILLTEGLTALAGDRLRTTLGRLTGSRLKAVLSGAAITALVQSSHATTLATIGFVSAGLLSLSQAIGVVIGANLGTTSTGWLVSLLGLKLSIGSLLLPLVGIGVLLRLLGKGRLASAGIALAGFGVLFVGLDLLQGGMGGLAERIDLSRFGAATLGVRFMLLLVGLVMTLLMQSSSAALAITLTALASGTLSLEQAGAMVIGQNLGSTFTAALAAIGATVAARRTALIHILFNIGAGTLAFFILPLLIWLADWLTGDGLGDHQALTLAAFHTLFNLLGAALFLPFTAQLAALAERLLPEPRPALTRHLDASMQVVPSLAVEAAHQTLRQCAQVVLQNAAARLRNEEAGFVVANLDEARDATEVVARYLARLPEAEGEVLNRLNACLHLLDHVRQSAHEALKIRWQPQVQAIIPLSQHARELASLLLNAAQALTDHRQEEEIEPALQALRGHNQDIRLSILQASATRRLAMEATLDGLTLARSCERLSYHGERCLFYLQGLAGEDKIPPGSLVEAGPDPLADEETA